jgi:hypothetical protein
MFPAADWPGPAAVDRHRMAMNSGPLIDAADGANSPRGDVASRRPRVAGAAARERVSRLLVVAGLLAVDGCVLGVGGPEGLAVGAVDGEVAVGLEEHGVVGVALGSGVPDGGAAVVDDDVAVALQDEP